MGILEGIAALLVIPLVWAVIWRLDGVTTSNKETWEGFKGVAFLFAFGGVLAVVIMLATGG